jgi:hypothetical protein
LAGFIFCDPSSLSAFVAVNAQFKVIEMIRSLVFLVFILMSIQIQAQQSLFVQIDFSDIQSTVASENSPFYFPVLFERYRNNDTTMSMEEYRHLYYGYTFQEKYQPSKKLEVESIIEDLLLKDTLTSSDFSLVYDHCMEIVQWHPFSTRYLLTAAIACTRLGKNEEARKYYYQYDRIISAILSSGDGATEKSAWSVILITDEYELIGALGFQRTGKQKMLSKSLCDFVYVTDNEYGIVGFYFDISRPFSKGFNNK